MAEMTPGTEQASYSLVEYRGEAVVRKRGECGVVGFV